MHYKPIEFKQIITRALLEDLGPGDLTTELLIPRSLKAHAVVRARMPLVVSGLNAFREVMSQIDKSIDCRFLAQNGDSIRSGETIVEITGPAGSILTAERVALNFLMRLSGVSTHTRNFVNAIGAPYPRLVDTRKTTPGLRILEKAAVRHGGAHNHRYALYDGILIKDNHISAVGSIKEAIAKAKAKAPHTLKIEIEVENLDQLQESLGAGADIVLLDNMPPDQLIKAVKLTEDFYAPDSRRVLLEASGGINISNIKEVAATGIDFISVGSLTHSAPSVDLGLDFL